MDTTGVEPTAHPGNLMDVVRMDVARPGFGVDAAMLNAPRRSGNQVMVPKVVDAS